MKNQNFNWQPVSFIPEIAKMIDGMLDSAQENLVNLEQAKDKPHVMDDYTVGRIFEVYRAQKADFWMYEEQLSRWQKAKLTDRQKVEIKRLQSQMVELKSVVDKNLKIGEFLKDNTIEKVMAKDDVELALEVLSGKRKI